MWRLSSRGENNRCSGWGSAGCDHERLCSSSNFALAWNFLRLSPGLSSAFKILLRVGRKLRTPPSCLKRFPQQNLKKFSNQSKAPPLPSLETIQLAVTYSQKFCNRDINSGETVFPSTSPRDFIFHCKSPCSHMCQSQNFSIDVDSSDKQQTEKNKVSNSIRRREKGKVRKKKCKQPGGERESE